MSISFDKLFEEFDKRIADHESAIILERQRRDEAIRLVDQALRLLSGNDNETPAPIRASVSEPDVNGIGDDIDHTLYRALTDRFQTVRELGIQLGRAGVKTSRGTVYNRIKALCERFPAIEERHTGFQAWRLASHPETPSTPVSGAGRTVKPKRTRKSSKSGGGARMRVIPATASPALRAKVIASARGSTGMHHGDCLDLMTDIPAASVDLILADEPYASCQNFSPSGEAIDIPLDRRRAWEHYRRIIKPTGNILLFADDRFALDLAASARDLFKYIRPWIKDTATNFNHARNRPLTAHENVLVFTKGSTHHEGRTKIRATFNQWNATVITKPNNDRRNFNHSYQRDAKAYAGKHDYQALENCSRTPLFYEKERASYHPFQKPIALLDDLIRAYSNPGDVVLDPCIGGGSTAIAAISAGRRWIGMEQDDHFFEVAVNRIAGHLNGAVR